MNSPRAALRIHRRPLRRGLLLALGLAALPVARPCRADDVMTALRETQPDAPVMMRLAQGAGAQDSSRPPAMDTTPPSKHRRSKHSDKMKSDVMDLTELPLEALMNMNVIGINVLGSHTHKKGDWMVGYRYMSMDMRGYHSGDRSLSNSEVLKEFPTIHKRMLMNENMLEVMQAPTDKLTLMAMIPYKQMTMNHLTRAGGHFSTQSDGLGDVTLMALQTVHGSVSRGQRFLINGGLSVPTGSINQRDNTPSKRNALLEYPMQLGSGTINLMPGVTYLGDSPNWSWGGQLLGTLPVGENERGYRVGNQGRISAWGVRRVTDWFAPSVRMDGRIWGNVHGLDKELNPKANPESDPTKQGGKRVDLLFGLNFYAPRGRLKGNRVMLEAGFPIYQSLNGPQIGLDWQWSAGWSYTF
jgi:hypothetical protein